MADNVNIQFIDEILNVIDTCGRAILNDECTENTLEHCNNQLTAAYRNCRRMSTRFPQVERLSTIIEGMVADIEQHKRSLRPAAVGLFAASQSSTRGRPLYVISREQLQFFVDAGFTRKQMAEMLHVSDSVVKRQLKQHNIKIRAKFSTLSDEELDSKVRDMTRDNNSVGQRMVQGMLRRERITVQRQRIADSLVRVDEANSALRWSRHIRRRVYKVSGANALWHIDGNHKLIRWGIVIHGGIDGYSRLVVFIRAATNNRSATMSKAFMEGTHHYGIPSRVRADHGLENTSVGAFMIAHRGTGRGSFITGRSVHNQRIERLWRDVFQSCTGVFHRLFHFMETSNQLDISNHMQLWCFQYVSVPRIQRALKQFQGAWNHHRLGKEGGRSPLQMFIQGIVQRAGQGHRGVDDLIYEPPLEQLPVPEEEYGIGEEVPIPAPALQAPEERTHLLPDIECPLSPESLRQLKHDIDPLQGEGLGLDVYLQVCEFCQAAFH